MSCELIDKVRDLYPELLAYTDDEIKEHAIWHLINTHDKVIKPKETP